MSGREDKNGNNLFFLCSLIEYIGRKTKNHRSVVVNALGRERLQHIFDLADVYHSENMDKIAYDLIKRYKIEEKTFDNIANAQFSIPTHWDIGKVYKRLIIAVSTKQNKALVDALIEVYNSWLSRKIEDFNSSVYYESPEYLYQSYLSGDVL
jgi:siroheme synthase (precorrin-2 oxidase/ferrochelatase)